MGWFDPDAGRDARYDYLYEVDELRPWSERIRAIEAKARRVLVVTNNHFGGKAVVNALELKSLHGEPLPEVPERWITAFPRLRGVTAVSRGGQLDLFAS